MPSSMTHTYFGMDVYQELKSKYQKYISSKQEYFKLFCQGSDPFMFYHFLLGIKAKRMKELQKRMHMEKTQEFFLTTIHYIHDHHLIHDEEVIAYLYGYICHYYLDLYTHPFIYYKSGVFDPEDKNTYSYNGVHQEIEYMIDCYLIETREKEASQQFKVYEKIFQISSFSPTLKDLIEESIGITYSIPNVTDKYEKAIWYMKNFFRYINYDPYGIKLRIYKLIDKISPKKMIRLQELSYYNDYQDKLHYLNLEHHEWCYPWDNGATFQTSFIDLYNQAKIDAIATIQEVTDLLEKEHLEQKRLKKIFPNLSFTTGKTCQETLKFQYFEF